MNFDFAAAFAAVGKKQEELSRNQFSSDHIKIVDTLTSSSNKSKKKNTDQQHEQAQMFNALAARNMAESSIRKYNAKVIGIVFFTCGNSLILLKYEIVDSGREKLLPPHWLSTSCGSLITRGGTT